MISVLISVTAEDILNGKPRIARECPVALAIIRAVTEEFKNGVSVGLSIIVIYEYEVWLPVEASKWIRLYDDNPTAAQPFSFHLDLPNRVLPLPQS